MSRKGWQFHWRDGLCWFEDAIRWRVAFTLFFIYQTEVNYSLRITVWDLSSNSWFAVDIRLHVPEFKWLYIGCILRHPSTSWLQLLSIGANTDTLCCCRLWVIWPGNFNIITPLRLDNYRESKFWGFIVCLLIPGKSRFIYLFIHLFIHSFILFTICSLWSLYDAYTTGRISFIWGKILLKSKTMGGRNKDLMQLYKLRGW
jgi:hypothetical protein